MAASYPVIIPKPQLIMDGQAEVSSKSSSLSGYRKKNVRRSFRVSYFLAVVNSICPCDVVLESSSVMSVREIRTRREEKSNGNGREGKWLGRGKESENVALLKHPCPTFLSFRLAIN